MPNTSRQVRLIDALAPAFDKDWGITARYQWSKNRRVMWCPAEDKLMIIGLLTAADRIEDVSKICDRVNTTVLPSKNGKQIKLRHCNLAKGTKRKPKRQQANLICTLRALLKDKDGPSVAAPEVSLFAQEHLQPKKSTYPFKELPPPARLSVAATAGQQYRPGTMMTAQRTMMTTQQGPGMLTTQQVATVLTVAALMPQPQQGAMQPLSHVQQQQQLDVHQQSHTQLRVTAMRHQYAGGAPVPLQPAAVGLANSARAGFGIALLTQAASETLVLGEQASFSEDSMFIENCVGPSVAGSGAGLGAGYTPAAAVLAAAGTAQPTHPTVPSTTSPTARSPSPTRPRRTNVFSRAVVPEDTMDAETAAGMAWGGISISYMSLFIAAVVAVDRCVCGSARLLERQRMVDLPPIRLFWFDSGFKPGEPPDRMDGASAAPAVATAGLAEFSKYALPCQEIDPRGHEGWIAERCV